MSYVSETGKGKVTKDALLNDSDNLWAEFRHEHIAKVLNDLGKLGGTKRAILMRLVISLIFS